MINHLAAILHRIKNRHFLVLDFVLFPLATLLAFLIRLESFDELWVRRDVMLYLIPLVTCGKVLSYVIAGLYKRFWPYASVDEFIRIGFVSGAMILWEYTLLAALSLFPWHSEHLIPLSTPFLDSMLTFFFFSASRFSVRMVIRTRDRLLARDKTKQVLIIGAGEAGVKIVEEMQHNVSIGLSPIGFLDDDPRKVGSCIRGISVLDTIDNLERVVMKVEPDEVIIAIPSASGAVIKNISNECIRLELKTRIVPGFSELLDGGIALSKLREVKIDDLLRRAPIRIDQSDVATMLTGRRVFITGGGGSIGSELVRQIWQQHPSFLGILGHGENSIFEIMAEMKKKDPEGQVRSFIGDIRDPGRMEHIIAEARPELLFHAAAHKHVPLMEENVVESVTNNILGTLNVCNMALKYNVEKLVMVSTDKAVAPTNVMGVTKRVAEILVQYFALTYDKAFVAVRFGNVLGSRGSVVPFFKAQIAKGGPVTITHPDITRYFMTIPEAVQLVLQSATMGTGGDLYILDMGEPVRIVDLARDLIRLSGLEPDVDIRLEFTGLRPGEKMYEELVRGDEELEPTRHQKIFRCMPRSGVENIRLTNGHGVKVNEFNRYLQRSAFLFSRVNELRSAANYEDIPRLLAILKEIVPEFQHDVNNKPASDSQEEKRKISVS